MTDPGNSARQGNFVSRTVIIHRQQKDTYRTSEAPKVVAVKSLRKVFDGKDDDDDKKKGGGLFKNKVGDSSSESGGKKKARRAICVNFVTRPDVRMSTLRYRWLFAI